MPEPESPEPALPELEDPELEEPEPEDPEPDEGGLDDPLATAVLEALAELAFSIGALRLDEAAACPP